MDPQEFFGKVLQQCPELVQPSWVPEKSTKIMRPSISATKFGGCSPWVSENWKWPRCSFCEKPTSFLLQINLADLPKEFKTRMNLSDGLFQLFDCIGCFRYNHGAWGSARIVPREDIKIESLQYLAAVASKDLNQTLLPLKLQRYISVIENPSEIHPHWGYNDDDVCDDDDVCHDDDVCDDHRSKAPLKVFEEFGVVNWKRNDVLEIPDNDEWDLLDSAMDKLGIEFDDIQDIDYINLEEKSYKVCEDGVEMKIGGPSVGTKVGGWLDWYSSLGYPGYPKCSDCPDKPLMKSVFLQLNIRDLKMISDDIYLYPMYTSQRDTNYPELIFISLCPSCQKPALFESFPPALEPAPFDPRDYYEIVES